MTNVVIEDPPQTRRGTVEKRTFNPARQALLNGCVNFAKGLLSVGVTVALTPFLVSRLGASDFGIWSLLGLFVTYIMLIDMGISGSTAKFMGALSLAEDERRMSRVFTASLVLVVGIALGVMMLVLIFRHTVEASLGVFGLFGENARVFLFGAVGLYSVGMISNGLSFVLLGLHRLDVANYIAASVLLVQAAGTVAVLEFGLGLRGLIGLMTGAAVISVVAYAVAVRKLAPGMHFDLRDFSFRTVGGLVSFGIYLQGYALLCVYYIYMGKTIASLRFPLAAVGTYEVALRLPILLRQGVSTILGPMMPAVARLDAGGRAEKVRELLLKALRYSVLLGAPVFVGLTIFADPVIRIWVGSAFLKAVLPLRILSVGFGLSVFPDLVWFFLVGLGRQRFGMICSVLQVVCGTVFSFIFAARWGLGGIALGVLLTSVFGAVLYAALLDRENVVSFSDLPLVLTLKVVVIAGVAFSVVYRVLLEFRLSYRSFALSILLASAAYFLFLVKAGVLEDKERLFLRGFLPRPLHFLC